MAPAPSLVEAAAAMALSGYFVFPVRGKAPLTKHGFKDAVANPDCARVLFAGSGATGIGVDCGRSRLVVVDVDGAAGFIRWIELGGKHDWTLTATTGRAHYGYHYYFRTEGDPPPSKRLAAQLETKGAGGYVIAPPSVHPAGREYRWLRFCDPLPAPGWLLNLHKPDPPPAALGVRRDLPFGVGLTPYGAAAIRGLLADVMDATPGRRNTTLHAAARRAGRLTASGEVEAGLAKRELLAAAEQAGLPWVEAERTFESGFTFGLQFPTRRAR